MKAQLLGQAVHPFVVVIVVVVLLKLAMIPSLFCLAADLLHRSESGFLR